MKLKNFFLFFLTFINLYSCAQSKQEKSFPEYGFFLEPIIGNNILLKEKKDDVLNRFDKFVLFENEYDNTNIYYEVNKTIKLPNNTSTDFHGTLAFNKDDELIYFNLSLVYGNEYEYWEDIITILKKADKHKINNFIYECEKVICNEENSTSFKSFSRGRNFEKVHFFEINFKCTFLTSLK